MSFELFISQRYLKAKKQKAFISLTTFLSIAGVIVGVTALIVVISVMSGLQTDLKDRILGVQPHITILGEKSHFSDYKDILSFSKNMGDVISAFSYIESQVVIRSTSGMSGAVLKGLEPEISGMALKNSEQIVFDTGNLENKGTTVKSTNHGIVLGSELALNLGVTPGDTVFIISPKGMISPIGNVPLMKKFIITGLYTSGIYQHDGSIAYIKIEDARQILRLPDVVTGIELRIENMYKAGNIAEQILSAYGSEYVAKTWMEVNRNLFSALKLEKMMMFIILSLIIFVAALNIAGSLIMMVMEKTRDIAILKALGATNNHIKKIFIYNGMFIGFIGMIVGLCLGLLLCFLLEKYEFIKLASDVYYITTLPVNINFIEIFTIIVVTLIICFCATLYPAVKASKFDPIESIRFG